MNSLSTLVLGGILFAAACSTGITTEQSFSGTTDATTAQPTITRANIVAEDVGTLLVLRYPQRASKNAVTAINQLYRHRGLANRFYELPDENERLAWNISAFPGMTKLSGPALDSALIKTTYLAMSMYERFSKKFGADRVRLQPYEIDIARYSTGHYGSPDLNASDPIARLNELVEREAHKLPPGLITIDLFSYVDPFYMIGSAYFQEQRSHPSTYGKTFTPLVSMYSVPEAAPKTNGGIAISGDLAPYAYPDNALRKGLSATVVDYLNGLKGVPLTHPGRDNVALAASGMTVFPQVEFFLDQSTLQRDALTRGPSTVLDLLIDDFAKQIDIGLSRIDQSAAKNKALVTYTAFYDRKLAARLLSGALEGSDNKRIAAIEKFYEKEREFLGIIDQKLIEEVLHGQWGQLVRETMVAEQGFADEYAAAREQQQQQQMMQALLFASTSLSTGPASTPLQSLQRSTQMLSMSLSFVDENRQLGQRLASDFEAFNRSIAYTAAAPLSFSFEVFGHRETITATTLDQLRGKMRAIYVRASSR